MVPCESTVAGNGMIVAERHAAIAQLQAEVGRIKSTKRDGSAAWRAKAEHLERDLMVL